MNMDLQHLVRLVAADVSFSGETGHDETGQGGHGSSALSPPVFFFHFTFQSDYTLCKLHASKMYSSTGITSNPHLIVVLHLRRHEAT
jgi:hypothetical protein